MAAQAIVTVVTRNYLHYAAVLMESCRQYHPAARLVVLVADRLPPEVPLPDALQGCGAEILYGDQLTAIEQWSRFAFQYTPFELACALKPFAMLQLVDQGAEQVIFVDADIALYAPLLSITQALQDHSIALIPHLHQPLPQDGEKPSEHNFLNAGTFNGGLIACRADAVGRSFLAWWQNRLRQDCYVDVAGGVFVDQKWLNLVPGLFPDVGIVRHPGCNAGHWTLSQQPLTGDLRAGYRVGDFPLECFHFSNFLPSNPYEFLRSQTRVSFHSLPPLAELVRDYHARLSAAHAESYTRLGCAYERLADGTPIPPEWREAIRRNHRELPEIDDPFTISGQPELCAKLRTLTRRAHKWRADWRWQLPSEQRRKEHRRRWRNYWRALHARWPRG